MRAHLASALNALLATFISLLVLYYCLEGTVLNADFVTRELQKLDLPKVTTELLSRHFSDPLSAKIIEVAGTKIPSVTAELSQEQVYGTESVKATLDEEWPALSEQVDDAIHSVYGYFLEDDPSLKIAIPLEGLQHSLKQHLEEAIVRSPAPEMQGASQAQIGEYVDAVYAKQFGHVPSEFKLSNATRVNLRYFSLQINTIQRFSIFLPELSKILIVLILALAAGVILVRRNLGVIFWNLGITLLASGCVGLIYSLLAKQASVRVSALPGLPTANVWIVHVVTDVVATINEPVRVLFELGIGMLVISIIFILILRPSKPRVAKIKAS
jgi:hypothetical protein